jgi:peptidoglycan/LPS O-acetylase OafA/YrhL
MARVESLRAIAALGVCSAHAWGLGHNYGVSAHATFLGRVIYGGGYGVFFFFGLSGYLLFWPRTITSAAERGST